MEAVNRYTPLILATLFGIFLHWMISRPEAPPGEHVEAKPEAPLKDGGVVVAREEPKAKPPRPHYLPEGSTVTRQATVTIRPEPVTIECAGEQKIVRCPDVVLDLTQFKDQEGGTREAAHAQGGEIIGAVDTPVGPVAPVVRDQRWRGWVIGACDVDGSCYPGGAVGRAVGPFEIMGGAVPGFAFVGAGLRF
jgi:hypothetical protein